MKGNQAAASSRIHETVSGYKNVFAGLTRNIRDGGTFHIEDIQDQVELALMRDGHQKVARSYVLYREQRNLERTSAEKPEEAVKSDTEINVTSRDSKSPLDTKRLELIINEAWFGDKRLAQIQ